MKAENSARFRLELNNIEVSYDNFQALRSEHVIVDSNILAVIGHNGAGKSTLIKTALGLLQPRRGSIQSFWIQNGQQLLLIPERDMAFCPESGSVFADISVQSYIEFWCRFKHGNSRYYRKEGRQFIELLDIYPLLSKLGRELSKGQRRRVQTAIGFLTKPRLFLFDEPFDGLDVQRSAELSQVISNQRSETCFIISSHRMDVIERLADSILVLQNGSVFASGDLSSICKTLAPHAVRFSNLLSPEAVIDYAQRSLRELVINQIGNSILAVGEHADLDRLQLIAREIEGVHPRTEIGEASLVDAMSFHLKSHSVRGKI